MVGVFILFGQWKESRMTGTVGHQTCVVVGGDYHHDGVVKPDRCMWVGETVLATKGGWIPYLAS